MSKKIKNGIEIYGAGSDKWFDSKEDMRKYHSDILEKIWQKLGYR